MTWYVYILETLEGRLYTGMTNNFHRRFEQHRSGRGARFTKIYGAKKLCFLEEFGTRVEAMRAEWAIKQMQRKDKLTLFC